MAIQLDNKYETLETQLHAANSHLPKDPRAELEVTPLSEPPKGLENHSTAFMFDPSGLLTRLFVKEGNGRFNQVMLIGPIPRERRVSIAKAFGFNPSNQRKLIVDNFGGFPSKLEYTISNQSKRGGVL